MKSNWIVFPHSLPFSLVLGPLLLPWLSVPHPRCSGSGSFLPLLLSLSFLLFFYFFLLHSPTCVDSVLELCSCVFLSSLQVSRVAQCIPGSILHISVFVILIVHTVILLCCFFHSGETALPELSSIFSLLKSFGGVFFFISDSRTESVLYRLWSPSRTFCPMLLDIGSMRTVSVNQMNVIKPKQWAIFSGGHKCTLSPHI